MEERLESRGFRHSELRVGYGNVAWFEGEEWVCGLLL
jgi:hypothetical protein